VDIFDERVIGKLLPLLSVNYWAASPSGKSVAFTSDGTVHTTNFPDEALVLSGAWVNVFPNGWDDDECDEHEGGGNEYFHMVIISEMVGDIL
jgi:hypothetical protein